MKIRKELLVAGGIFFLTIAMAVGCAKKEKSPAEEKQEEKKDEEPKEEILKIIGEEKEGENVYKLVVENKTGRDILGVSIKDSSQEEFPNNLINANDKFSKDERRYLFYEAPEASDEQAESESIDLEEGSDALEDTDEKILEVQYDVQLTFDDGSIYVLNAFPFGDIEEGMFCFEDEVAFIKYVSLENKGEVSTKEAELNIKAEAEAAAQAAAEAEAKAAAEAEAAAKAEAEAKAKAEAEAAAAAQRQQQQQSKPAVSNSNNDSQGCVGDDAAFW